MWSKARQWLGGLPRRLWFPFRWMGRQCVRAGQAVLAAAWAVRHRLGRPGTALLQRIRPALAAARSGAQHLISAAGRSLLEAWVRAVERLRSARRVVSLQWQARRGGRSDSRIRTLRGARPSGKDLARLTAALAALNVVLVILLVRQSLPPERGVEAIVPSSTATSSPTAIPSRTATPTSTPSPEPILVTPAPTLDSLAPGGSVAYVARENGNDDIYLLSVGLPRPIRLTHHPADDREPAWSPDGTRLAFASRRDGDWDIYVLQVASGELTRLTDGRAFEAHPAWSPDGEWLAFEAYRDGNLDIYVRPAAGGEARRITTHPAADYSPSWAPSGRHIAFVSRRDGNPDIFLFPLDDARDEACINISRSPQVEEDHPAWHPGGKYLAFSGRRGSRQLVYAQPLMNNLPAGEPLAVAQGDEPTWAPNGDVLLYSHNQAGRHYLLASPVDGWGAAPQVVEDSRPLRTPNWIGAALPAGLWAADLYGDDEPLFWEIVANPADEGPPYTLVTLDDLQVSGPFLSDRVDGSFEALRRRVIEEVGWDLLGELDKIFEPLDALPPPGVDSRSWNMAGRAIDIQREYSAGFRPVLEVVQEIAECQESALSCSDDETYWRLYVRAWRQDGSQGEPMRALPWDFQARYSGNSSDYGAGGRPKAEIPGGYYVDLTQLAADYGWLRIPSAPAWRTHYPAVLFWHLENRQGLSWEQAMIELYPAKELQEAFGGFEP